MFFSSSIHAPWCFSNINVITLSTFYVISHALSLTRYFSIFSTHWAIPLSHFRDLNGSDLWSNFLTTTPAFSTTLILKPCGFISFWYLLCSCEFGIDGTKLQTINAAPSSSDSWFGCYVMYFPRKEQRNPSSCKNKTVYRLLGESYLTLNRNEDKLFNFIINCMEMPFLR